MARHLIRVLVFLQVRGGFSLEAAYIRTYHNNTPDLISRAIWEEAQKLLEKEMGFSRVDLHDAWQEAASLGFARRA